MNRNSTLFPRFTAYYLGLATALALPAALADRTTGETIDDSTVATSVKASLVDDEVVPAGDINIEAYKGTVQLIGFVPSDAAKKAAVARAELADGVEKVVDALIVVPEKRSFGTTVDDQTIETKVKMKLTDVGTSEALAVVTEVRNGEVLLGGFVKDDAVGSELAKAAEGVDGVTKVHNFIQAKN